MPRFSSLRQVFKELTKSSQPVAVLLFPHGLEQLSIQADTPEQKAQLQRLLQDFSSHLVGVYDQSVVFADLCDDVRFTESQLFYGPTL